MKRSHRQISRVDYSGQDDTPDSAKKDGTFKGGRVIGDSSALAKARYHQSKKRLTFDQWKKGREAQHLFPASLAKQFGFEAIVDTARNGMMLPTVQTDPAHIAKSPSPVIQQKGITKPFHKMTMKHRDHPQYTKAVKAFAQDLFGTQKLKRNLHNAGIIMDALRDAHKTSGATHTDKIKLADLQASWPRVNKKAKF
jgi:hypothetical protein